MTYLQRYLAIFLLTVVCCVLISQKHIGPAAIIVVCIFYIIWRRV